MASHEAQAMKKKFSEFVLKLSGTEEAPVSVEEMRATYDGFAADLTGKPSGVTWAEVDVAGVPAVWTDPAGGATDRVVQYVHGGGYVIGSAKAYQSFAGHIAKAVGCRVLNVDYRLAPEHPHPAPVEDSSTAYRWLLSQGYDPSHVAIAGDSAGGGLTLTTLLALRQAETPQPAASVPISPWADMEVTGATMVTNAETDFLQQPMLLGMAELFLGGHDPRDPLAAPLHADFAELPPMYIQCISRRVEMRRYSTMLGEWPTLRRQRASMSRWRCFRRCNMSSSSARAACPKRMMPWLRSACSFDLASVWRREFRCHYNPAPPSARMPSPPRSAKAAWAKCIEHEIPSSTGTWR